jgi:hypothetical protein
MAARRRLRYHHPEDGRDNPIRVDPEFLDLSPQGGLTHCHSSDTYLSDDSRIPFKGRITSAIPAIAGFLSREWNTGIEGK